MVGTYRAATSVDDIFKNAAHVRCSPRTHQKLESLLPAIFPAGTDQPVPENGAQLQKYCDLCYENFPFVLGYFNNCVDLFSKIVAKVGLYSLKKQLDATCKPGKISRQTQAIMELGGCANKARGGIHECNGKLYESHLGIKSAPVRDRNYMSCW